MKPSFSRRTVASLMITLFTAKMLFVYPRYMLVSAGSAAWIQGLIAILAAFIIFFVTALFYRPRMSLIAAAGELGGGALRIPVGILVFAALILNMAVTVRAYPESVSSILLSHSNIEMIMAVFIAAAAIGAYLGLGALARINAIFLPIALAAVGALCIFLPPKFRLDNLFPLLGTGAAHVFGESFHFISLFSDLIALDLLLPYCRTERDGKEGGFLAVMISGLVVMALLFACIFIFPYPSGTEFVMPVYELARLIYAGEFFGRLEALFEFIWSIFVLLYAAVYLYLIAAVWRETFAIGSLRPLIIPISALAACICWVPSSTVELVHAGYTAFDAAAIISFGLPLVIGIFYKIKMRKRST